MIVIIDYNCGNVASVGYSLSRLGVSYTISNDPQTIQSASGIILPGVGHAKYAMQQLHQLGLKKTRFLHHIQLVYGISEPIESYKKYEKKQ